jgi:endoglucanase
MRELIKQLSDMRGISGFEYRLTDKIADMFKEYADEVNIDALGNVIAVKKCGIENAPKIMIEAHCDEIGLMVTSVTDEGYLTFANVGGVDERTLPLSEVVVHAKEDIYGVIGIKPSYLQEAGKTTKIKDMAIDTGLDADTVKELVSVGDSVTLPQSVGRLGKKQWSGKSLDDRASIAAVITAMKKLHDEEIEVDVYAVATAQEEVGCRGAKTASYGINPDMAIAIDVTHGITPDNSTNAFEVGCGSVISVGPNLHTKLTNRLFDTARKHDIKVETDVDGGNTGTDAWEIQVSRAGIPTALLSIPLKYMHTSVETLAVSDVKATSKLIVNFIKDLKGDDLSWLTF